LEIFLVKFQKGLNEYFTTGNLSTVDLFIGSDDLRNSILNSFQTSQSTGEFNNLTIESVEKADFQYIVEGHTILKSEKEESELSVMYKCIKVENEWKIISMVYVE
jgi:hypothetical protein